MLVYLYSRLPAVPVCSSVFSLPFLMHSIAHCLYSLILNSIGERSYLSTAMAAIEYMDENMAVMGKKF